MKGSSAHLSGVVSLLLASAPAYSDIIFDDGLEHAISTTVVENVRVSHASTLEISGTGSVTGAGGAFGVVTVGGSEPDEWVPEAPRNQLIISGHARVVGDGPRSGLVFRRGYSDVRVRNHGYISSISSISSVGGWNADAPQRVFLEDHATVGEVSMTGFISMADSARVTGNLHAGGPLTAWLNGGVIQGEMNFGGLDKHSLLLDGTSILGGLRLVPSIITMEMKSGLIGGPGLTMRGTMMNATIFGGHIDGGISRDPTDTSRTPDVFSIFGGSIDAGSNDWLIDLTRYYDNLNHSGFSLLDIRGGQFGYGSAAGGFLLDGYVNFDVYGWDLQYLDGQLTGFLADGNYINVGLMFGSDWQGIFNMHDVSVPEPGSLVLFGVALLGLSLFRRVPRAS